MNMRTLVIAMAVTGVVVAASYGGFRLGMNRGTSMAGATAPAADPAHGANGVDTPDSRKVLYWHDPMVPAQKFDKPGKSPFMDMQLVPVYADGDSDTGTVSISARMQQNLGVRTAEVSTGAMTQKLDVVGSIAYNERDVAVVTARTAGFVESLYVRAPLDPVRKGQPLAELYAPEWIAAQEEYLSVRRMQGQGVDAVLAAARQRMLLAGMSEDQVRVVETAGKANPRFTLAAPIGGVISELGVREGMTVAVGSILFKINGLSSVWAYAEIAETRVAQIRPGHRVVVHALAAPGRLYQGRVAAILPEVNAATRTLRARIEVANADGSLTPGMFANIDFAAPAKAAVLTVPSEAVIHTGQRKVVFVETEPGKYQPVDVDIGAEAHGQTEIRKGLTAGQKVVISGQFLIDSESSLKATATRMSEPPDAPPTQRQHGTGK